MTLKNIPLGSYGFEIVMEVQDTDTSSAIDISSYTAQIMDFEDPDGNVASLTAAFDSDGTDGKIAYTVADGDIDEEGTWQIRAKLTRSGVVLYSTWAGLSVTD